MSQKLISYRVVIPVDPESTTAGNEKGRRFEALVREFLQFQSYEVIERFRDAGTEIDLKCRNKLTGSTAIVECKAHELRIQSEVVNKLFADSALYEASDGWIFSVSELGAEARTRLEKLSTAGRRFRFFASDELVRLLIDAGSLSVANGEPAYRLSAERLLVVLPTRQIWAAAALDAKGDRPIGHLAWDASTGQPIPPNLAPDLSATDFPLSELSWLAHQGIQGASETPSQAVIEVIPGDEWSDYRPSRPVDFVGRSDLIGEVREYLQAVVDETTPTRLFGIKGRSGWGKSSLALKLANDLAPAKVYVFPVDCRAANSSFYADLAISRALTHAANDLLYGPLFAPQTDFRANPFEEPSVASFLADVARSGGLVCVIFDQFEAIIHRPDLRAVFDRLREIALFADELRGPVVIGFSWKTDGTVSSDNPGYHVWHSLSDRRRDFVVDKFTREDADDFLSLALRSAKIKLPISVTQFILQHYAGYPWLLKKLIRHCVDHVKRAGSQVNVSSFFNISSLFENDLQELSQTHAAALKFVAQESPVELHIVEDKFGTDTINALIERRLVIKSGNQLSLYWDIFRDYILNGQLPQIPNTYVPTLSVRRIRGVIKLILSRDDHTYQALARQLGISLTTADNTVRDLANMGLVNSDRYSGLFQRCCESPEGATKQIIEFLKSHTVFLKAKEVIESGDAATLETIEDMVQPEYSFISIDRHTLRNYVRKIIVYCIDFGLLSRQGPSFQISIPVVNILEQHRSIPQLNHDEMFRGAAPPQRVVELLSLLKKGQCRTLKEASARKLRNAVYAASSLGLVEHRDGMVTPIPPVLEAENLTDLVADYARHVEPIRTIFSDFPDLPTLSADEIGVVLSDMLELNWSPSSCHRYGFALKTWHSWIETLGMLGGNDEGVGAV